MTDEQFTRQTDEHTVVVATKLPRTAAERLAKIAKKKKTTIYALIQMCCDTIIRYMDDRHNLSEEMERAMAIFEHMTRLYLPGCGRKEARLQGGDGFQAVDAHLG